MNSVYRNFRGGNDEDSNCYKKLKILKEKKKKKENYFLSFWDKFGMVIVIVWCFYFCVNGMNLCFCK